MAEFDVRMAHARAMNAGRADAYSAGLLSREEAYYFRAWSTYQLDLVRAIQREGFPDAVSWPDEPASFEVASAPAMAEFDARMAKAATFTDGKAEAYAAHTLVGRGHRQLSGVDRLRRAMQARARPRNLPECCRMARRTAGLHTAGLTDPDRAERTANRTRAGNPGRPRVTPKASRAATRPFTAPFNRKFCKTWQLTITTACALSKSTKARDRFAPYQRPLLASSRPASMRTKICSRSIRPCC